MKTIQDRAIDIARDLGYITRIPSIEGKLTSAKTEIEIERILVDARHYMSDLERARMARS